MLTVASLANQFPSPVEPYVGEEIDELRRRGLRVIAGTVWKTKTREKEVLAPERTPEVVLQSLRAEVQMRAAWLCVRRWRRISSLILRVVLQGSESPLQRLKTLLHTWMGACYAVDRKSTRLNSSH